MTELDAFLRMEAGYRRLVCAVLGVPRKVLYGDMDGLTERKLFVILAVGMALNDFGSEDYESMFGASRHSTRLFAVRAALDELGRSGECPAGNMTAVQAFNDLKAKVGDTAKLMAAFTTLVEAGASRLLIREVRREICDRLTAISRGIKPLRDKWMNDLDAFLGIGVPVGVVPCS